MRNRRKAIMIFAWVFFAICAALIITVIHMGNTGTISDEMLTMCASFISMTMTTVIIVCGVLMMEKSKSERYNELVPNEEDKKG